jgi:hypothetical protein
MLDGDDLPAAASGDDIGDDLGAYLDQLDGEGDGDGATDAGDGGAADADDLAAYLGDLGLGGEEQTKTE